MSMEQEVHDIKAEIKTLSNTVTSLVKSIGNIRVIENQQQNDQRTVDQVSRGLEKLSGVVGQLNTTITNMNGVDEGKAKTARIVWLSFGGLVTISIVSLVTTVLIMYSDIAVLKRDIVALEKSKS